jgi:hypothetical protein
MSVRIVKNCHQRSGLLHSETVTKKFVSPANPSTSPKSDCISMVRALLLCPVAE